MAGDPPVLLGAGGDQSHVQRGTAATTSHSGSDGAAVHGRVGGLQAAGVGTRGDAQGHVTEAMFSLPEGDNNVAADARHTLDTLGLAAVVETRTGGQRLVLAYARGPGLDGVDVIGEIYGTMVGSS